MKKTADMGWGSDAYPGEEPETQAINDQSKPRPRRDWTEQQVPDPADMHNWVYINGHIVMDSERAPEQLVEDHGFKDVRKPLAYGRVAVQHRWTAAFQVIHTNVSLAVVLKALKGYAKEQGWNDLSFVDHNGHELAMNPVPALVTAADVGTGWNTSPPDWRNTDDNPGNDIQYGEFHKNPAGDAPKSALYECPDCGMEFEDYTQMHDHMIHEKSPAVDGDDVQLPSMDDVMPAGWNNNTSPDWVRIMSAVDHPEPVPAEPGTTPIPPGHMRLYHYTNSYPSFEAIKQHGIKNEHAVGESYGEPSQIWASAQKPEDHKAYFEFSMPTDDPRLGIGAFYPYTNDKTGEPHTPETWAEYMVNKRSDVTIPYGDIEPHEIIAAHEPWHRHYRYLQDMRDQYPEDYEEALSGNWDTVPDVKNAVDRINMERGRVVRTSAVTPVELPGPIPFIYDIQDDRVYVGHPGEETQDIPAGDYNPLGIVEGLYKPTGEVEIETQTNMPYTVRHMIQLWYYMHPELPVKSVVFVYPDGQTQKLAGRRPFDKKAMALRPDDLDAWIEKNGPYMVHWTKPEHVESIMRQGIKPAANPMGGWTDEWNDEPHYEHGPEMNWDGYTATRPGHVYMATPDNNEVKVMENSKKERPFQHPIHIDVRKLDPTKFKADEDWAKANWDDLRPEDVDTDDWYMEGPPDATYWDADSETLGDWAEREGLGDEDWTHKSLQGSGQGGSLAYEGEIPPHALIDPWDNKMAHTAAAPDNVGEKIRTLLKQDPSAVEVYDALAPLGNVYVVGGAIRDLALGLIPKDIDIMAQGIEPDDVIRALKQRPGHVEVTGNQFPVIRYFHPSGEQCEVALPRREESTGGGGRKDFNVNMDIHMPVEEDLERRDFTGNSMAVDLKTGQLIDPYGGWQDLENGELKMVHPRAFEDDATRILRALSSKSRHGLHPDEDTQRAMTQWSHRIDTHVPAEQKAAELEKLMKGNDPASAIELAQQTDVLKHVLPEVADTYGFDQKNKHHSQLLFDHMINVLRETARLNKDPDVRMAALLHDIGKPGSQWFDDEGWGHYYEKHFKPDEVTGERFPSVGKDHEHHGADLARDRLKDLTWGNGDRQKRVEHLIRSHMFNPFEDTKGARKFLHKYDPNGEGHAEDLMDIRHADAGNKAEPWDGETAKMRELLEQSRQEGAATNLSQLALNGKDVMDILGIKPGKEVGEHLQRLQQIVLEEPALNTREDLTQALQMHTAKAMRPGVMARWASLRVSKEYDGYCWALIPAKAPMPDAPDADNSHVTLAMVKGMSSMSEDDVRGAIKGISMPIEAKITGCTAFPEGDDGSPIVLLISSPDIDTLREHVVDHIEASGGTVEREYSFIPHMTLGYAKSPEEIDSLTKKGDMRIGDGITFDNVVWSGGDGVWKTADSEVIEVKISNVLDPIQDTLDPDVFDQADKAKPKVKAHIVEWVHKKVESLLAVDHPDVLKHTRLVLTGSLTGYQWSHKSDFDVSVWFDYEKFPNIIRADMISLMVTELDGVIVPGTTHQLQCYIVPSALIPDDLYKPGLRSAYDLDKNKWLVAPERERVYNPYTEIPALMGWVHDQAEKLKLLREYDEPGAKEFERQIHDRRRRDQQAGKGDFSESNILWKYLEHMELV